jgi:hypothetical protein
MMGRSSYFLSINYLSYNHDSTVILDIAKLLQHSSLNAGSITSAASLLPSSVPTSIPSTWTYKYEAACAKQANQLADFDDDNGAAHSTSNLLPQRTSREATQGN